MEGRTLPERQERFHLVPKITRSPTPEPSLVGVDAEAKGTLLIDRDGQLLFMVLWWLLNESDTT